MKLAEFEQVLVKWLSNIADIWFQNQPMLLPLAKILIQANITKLEEAIKLFTDQNGNVMINELLTEYERSIPTDGLRIDFRSILGDNILTRNITIKVLERSDISQLKNMLNTKN